MSILKPVLVVAILGSALLCNYAWATEPPPRVGATREVLKEDNLPKKKPVKRRAVHAQLNGMPPSAAPPDRYTPQPAPPQLTQPMPPLPLPSAQAQDGSYKGGVGTTLIGPQGRLCSNNGITVQCF